MTTPSVPTEEVVDLSPFKAMVMTIGTIPTAFTESMTYYEALAYFVKFLDETVIPAINSNGEAVKELQELFVELHDYVEHYFDTLDIQTEVNNKLDEMAESGQLAEIISIYLNSNAILAYNTVADLEEAENVVDGSFARIYGKLVYNDGKGAFYKIRTIRNTDVIDGDNIVALPDETLVAEKMPDYFLAQTNAEVTAIKNTIKSIKDYGAKGDGETDDTDAILAALADLEDGDKLYFPAGDYILYNDYETNHNTATEAYDYDRLFKLVGKKNIVIFGDGVSSRIRPSYQGVSANKLSYPCTLSIYQCKNIEVKDLTIESKGESYGDVDGLGYGHPELMMCNGGNAILVGKSSDVHIHDCSLRYCGSVGVVYFSTISDCKINNCFINAASIGYACIAFDEYMGDGSSYNEKLNVDSCVMHKETNYQPEDGITVIGSTYHCGKGGVYTEGTENLSIYCDVTNCEISDCGSGGSSLGGYNDGIGIAFATTDGIIANNTLRNCLEGIRLYTWKSGCNTNVQGNIINALWNGIILRHAIGSQQSYNVQINDNMINVDTSTTIPDAARDEYKYHSGILSTGYTTYRLFIHDNYISANQGIRAIYTAYLSIKNNRILAEDTAFFCRAQNVTYNDNEITFGTTAISANTTYNSTNINLYITMNNNILTKTGENGEAILIQEGGGSNTRNVNRLTGNIFRNCYHVGTTYPIEFKHQMSPTSTSLSGTHTVATFTVTDMAFNEAHIVFATDGSTFRPESVQSQTDNVISIYYAGDVRTKLNSACYISRQGDIGG